MKHWQYFTTINRVGKLHTKLPSDFLLYITCMSIRKLFIYRMMGSRRGVAESLMQPVIYGIHPWFPDLDYGTKGGRERERLFYSIRIRDAAKLC